MNHRHIVQKSVNQLLDESIEISERVFQSLNITGKYGKPPSPLNIYSKLYHSFPAINMFYDKIGFKTENLGGSYHNEKYKNERTVESIHLNNSSLWKNQLARIFFDKIDYRTKKLNRIGQKIKNTNQLDLQLLTESILFHKRTDTQANALLRKIINDSNNDLTEVNLINFESKLSSFFNEISVLDSSYNDQQFIIYFENNKIKLRPFGHFGTYNINLSQDQNRNLSRTNIIQQSNVFSVESIFELEYLINKDGLERDFQNFFERNPIFLTTLGDYSSIHSQIILKEENGSDLIPDFFLEKIDSDFCDICDLKRPNAELRRLQKNRNRFKSSVYEAVAQLTNYRDYFEDSINRKNFSERYNIQSYRPKVVLIIGRQNSYYDDIEKIKIESQLPNWVDLKTYDNILNKAKFLNNLIGQ